MATTLLLIDDDASLGKSLRFMLTKKGFRVEIAYDAITGLQKAYALKPDAIILDVMLPDMDGLQVCRRFREMSDVPIMMLTALGTEQNIIEGLDRGADDYVVKPVTAGELSARIRALLRRSSRSTTPNAGNTREPIFSHDNLMIDFDKHEVTVEGKRVDLKSDRVSPPVGHGPPQGARASSRVFADRGLGAGIRGRGGLPAPLRELPAPQD